MELLQQIRDWVAEAFTFQRDSQNLSTRLRVLAGTRVVFVTGLLYNILRANGCSHHSSESGEFYDCSSSADL